MEHFLFALLILSMVTVSFGIEVNVPYEWKYAEYEWESQEQKETAIKSGTYNPYTCVFQDAEKAEDGTIFITVTNVFFPGSPATLTTVTNNTGPGGPLLRPYPDWSWYNSNCTCDGIANVYRVQIQCNHIFVLDSGKIGSDQICNPKLLIFDLKNDKLVKTIYIPLDIATNQEGSGLLTTLSVYVPGECTQFLDEMIIFLADTGGSGVVVYDSSTKCMCRVESDCMKPTHNNFSITGDNFIYGGGIFSLTVLHDELYYAPLSGKKICKIKIETLLQCPNKQVANSQTQVVKQLSSPTIAITSTEHSILYNDFEAMSILGTNIYKQSDKNTLVLAQDDEKLQSITSMKISRRWNQLTCLSDRFQRIALNTLDLSEINFRYFEMDLTEILKKMDLILLPSWYLYLNIL